MSMKIKFKYIILAVLLLIGLIFYLGWHFGTSKQRSLQTISENAYKNEVKRLTITLDNKTQFLATTQQVLESERQARKAGDIERKELRALNLKHLSELSSLRLQIDTLLQDIGHNGQIIAIHDTITKEPKNAIILPFEFEKRDQWLDLKGSFDKNGKLDIKQGLDFSADLIAGIDKDTKKNTAILKTDCPYIKTVTFKSIKFDTPKNKKYNVSLFVGYGLTKKLEASPVIAVGVGKTLFKF